MSISTTILSTLLLLAVAEVILQQGKQFDFIFAQASSLAKRDVTVKLKPPSEDPSVIGPEPECCLSKMVGPYNYTRVIRNVYKTFGACCMF